MKRFIIRIFILFLFVVAVDLSFGGLFSHLAYCAKGGNTGRINYIVNETDEDIIVLGSSRAERHYNPKIFQDSLGLTCYNCGQSGMGIISNYGIMELILHHHTPRLIIYDITPPFDMLECEDNHKYLGILRRFYDDDNISDIFNSVDKKERVKMVSRMYRYNSIFTEILHDYIVPKQSSYYNGFTPLNSEMDTMKIKEQGGVQAPFLYDSRCPAP